MTLREAVEIYRIHRELYAAQREFELTRGISEPVHAEELARWDRARAIVVADSYARGIADKAECPTVAMASATYADALITYGPDGLEWSIVNRAILKRWSKATLERIKRFAWKKAKQ